MKKAKKDDLNALVQNPNPDENDLPGYPIYPEGEDIYNIYLEESEIDPEDLSETMELPPKSKVVRSVEKDLERDFIGNDLDIPGSELDDEMENIGSEDEENNYYSLGGENHEDLEEDHGE